MVSGQIYIGCQCHKNGRRTKDLLVWFQPYRSSIVLLYNPLTDRLCRSSFINSPNCVSCLRKYVEFHGVGLTSQVPEVPPSSCIEPCIQQPCGSILGITRVWDLFHFFATNSACCTATDCIACARSPACVTDTFLSHDLGDLAK